MIDTRVSRIIAIGGIEMRMIGTWVLHVLHIKRLTANEIADFDRRRRIAHRLLQEQK